MATQPTPSEAARILARALEVALAISRDACEAYSHPAGQDAEAILERVRSLHARIVGRHLPTFNAVTGSAGREPVAATPIAGLPADQIIPAVNRMMEAIGREVGHLSDIADAVGATRAGATLH